MEIADMLLAGNAGWLEKTALAGLNLNRATAGDVTKGDGTDGSFAFLSARALGDDIMIHIQGHASTFRVQSIRKWSQRIFRS